MLAIEVQWQIFIKNLGGRTITLGVSSWYKILDVKFMIRDIEGIAMQQQRLIFAARELDDYHTIADYKLQKESTLQLLTRMLGD
jgi:hypothetical protein